MVQYCSVSGCSSRSRRDLVAFFRFPTVRKRFGLDLQEMIKLRREKWVNCIPRFKNVPEDKFKHARVCANHFISGKPAALQDIDDPDWVPSLNLRLEPRRVRLKRLAARAKAESLPQPDDPHFGLETMEANSSSTTKDLTTKIKLESPDEEDEEEEEEDETYLDLPNERLLEPEVKIEVLEYVEAKVSEARPHGYGCPLCKTTFERQSDLGSHVEDHRRRRCNTCVLCAVDFDSRHELQQHWVRTHSLNFIGRATDEGATFRCSSCDRAFERAEQLLLHRDDHRDRAYPCMECDRAFFNESRLDAHLRDAHGRAYVCDLCGRGFASKYALSRHLSRHADGNQLYRCGECSHCFKTAAARGRHRLAAHPPAERRFTCAQCDMDFPHADRLAQHALCHASRPTRPSRYEALHTLGDLKRHLATQSGNAEPPHPCHLCPLGFNRPSHLERHLATHATTAD